MTHLAIAFLIVLQTPLTADGVLLKSSGKIEGIARREGDELAIETPAGETTVALAAWAMPFETGSSGLLRTVTRPASKAPGENG
jgi:hypothetical protein